jgi:hypothetical protein
MMIPRPWFRAVIAVTGLGFAAGACGGDGDDDAPAVDGGGGDTDGAAGPDAGAPDGGEPFAPLVTAEWTLPAHTEGYVCARITVAEDTYIHELRPIAPFGTHHTVLALDDGGPDGTFECDAAEVGTSILFGSGVGTPAFELPDGIAFHVPAGEQVLLNLHLYNIEDAPLDGVSGVEILTLDPSEVTAVAESVFAGTFDLDLPPGESTATGTCTLPSDTTLFAVFPHMHQLGTHLAITALPEGGEPISLHDAPYSFDAQLNYRLDPPLALAAGDQVRVDCTYVNTTGVPVHFGDSSDAEMCIGVLYRYPAVGGGEQFCID